MYLPLEKYYTLDSANSLRSLHEIPLRHYTPKQPELADFLNQMYPEGLSKHGHNYLYNPALFDEDHQRDSALLIGLILELVRRSDFPDKPSRYQSLFACQHISEVKQFREQLADEREEDEIRTAPIYEVFTDEAVHCGDMRLLSDDCPVLELYRRAYLYWSGEPAPVREGKEEEKPFWELLIPLPVLIGRQISE
ncbi:Uncharacterised protein [Enterobacter roggenkampii]|uniref:DUF2441 domain-containing protein n=1 Tax=Enterobacter roggenkampii TaxID=1812935 RepID=A0ABY0J6W6_9ENTR|nr:Uncharacterised protein [Enterobacter roggenkampii]